MNTVTPALVRPVAGLLALLLLAACGGGGDGDEAATGDATADGTSQSADLDEVVDVPEGVTLTDAGTELQLAKPAMVAWQPRQQQVAAARVVVQKVERTSFDVAFDGYRITDQMAAMTPFFVRARVANPTDTNLGNVAVPLYLRDDAGTLVEETTLQGQFKPCPGGVLPKKFAKGAQASICLVFLLSQGRTFDSVAFQLPGGLEPITWTGKVLKYNPPKQPGNQDQQS